MIQALFLITKILKDVQSKLFIAFIGVVEAAHQDLGIFHCFKLFHFVVELGKDFLESDERNRSSGGGGSVEEASEKEGAQKLDKITVLSHYTFRHFESA